MDNLREHFIKPLDEYIVKARKICDHIGYDQIAYTLIRLINNSKCEAKCFTSVEQLANMYEYAHRNTERDAYQAMEATVHNLCTLASRAGAQVPFSSLNLGTCTSLEGRMVTRNLLLAVEAGLGYGETAIFPISIFKLKKGINRAPGDPNYDLKKLALRVTAKRLFPNFLNLDAPYNLKYYRVGRPETEVTAMGALTGSSSIYIDYRESCPNTSYPNTSYSVGLFAPNVTFEKMEEFLVSHKLTETTEPIKFDENTYYYNLVPGVQTADELSETGYATIKKFMVFKDPNLKWYRIHYSVHDYAPNHEVFSSHNSSIIVTDDHPLPVLDNIGNPVRTLAKDIKVGDLLVPTGNTYAYECEVYKIEPITDKQYVGYDIETSTDRFNVNDIVSHNCRTRTISNIHDPSKEQVTGRGNLFFTTINLPYLALEVKQEAKDGDDIVSLFFNKLEERLNDVVNLSMDRFNLIAKRKAKNYPFLMGQHLYVGSDDLHPDDPIGEVIKHGSMTAGFIGLAETLVALTGKHHGESAEAQALGLKIVKYMNDFMTEVSERTKLNFGVMGSPAEGCSGRLLRLTRKKFGTIEGVTDKDYLTNSFHVPVAMQLSAWDKIQIEAPYHQYCPAGHISYLELDADAVSNLDALETIIDTMCDNNMGYFAINHPVDRDPVCGYVGYFPDGVCPRCGRREGEGVPVSKLLSLRSYSPDPSYDARRESSAPTTTLNLVE